MILLAFELCSTLHLLSPSLFQGESDLHIECLDKTQTKKLIKCNNEKLKLIEVCDHTSEYKEQQNELNRHITICSKLEQIVDSKSIQ